MLEDLLAEWHSKGWHGDLTPVPWGFVVECKHRCRVYCSRMTFLRMLRLRSNQAGFAAGFSNLGGAPPGVGRSRGGVDPVPRCAVRRPAGAGWFGWEGRGQRAASTLCSPWPGYQGIPLPLCGAVLGREGSASFHQRAATRVPGQVRAMASKKALLDLQCTLVRSKAWSERTGRRVEASTAGKQASRGVYYCFFFAVLFCWPGPHGDPDSRALPHSA